MSRETKGRGAGEDAVKPTAGRRQVPKPRTGRENTKEQGGYPTYTHSRRSPQISKSHALCVGRSSLRPRPGPPGPRREAASSSPPGHMPVVPLRGSGWTPRSRAAEAGVLQQVGWAAGLRRRWVHRKWDPTTGQGGCTRRSVVQGSVWAAPSPGPQPPACGWGCGERLCHSRPPGAAGWPEPPSPLVRSAGAWGCVHPRSWVVGPAPGLPA